MTRTAACACGECSVTVTGEPLFGGLCHCQNCRQRTGSAFGWQAYWPEARVTLSGPLQRYDLAPEWGQQRLFCPRCGSTLAWQTMSRPGEFGVAVGGMEPPLPAPDASYRDSRRFDWVVLPNGCAASG
jgi:hypothetical protein